VGGGGGGGGGGSGGGGYFGGSKDVADLRSESMNGLRDAEAEVEIANALKDLLAKIDERDVETTTAHLDELLVTLRDGIDDALDLRFGGSVAKHTYVDGVSDIDVLVLLGVEAERQSPRDAVASFADAIRSAGVGARLVEVGRLAVTVTFVDGTVIQMLPAVRSGDHYAIASDDGSRWSEIRPRRFAEKLTSTNDANGGRLVPLIKLAKSAIAGLPEDRRPSGYHVESMAIEAFENYQGPRALRPMLSHFFHAASDLSLRPIRDSTGQSVHVDDSLGGDNSLARQLVSDSLARIGRRLDSAQSADQVRQVVDPV
jgi:hypothetical protein